MMKKRNSPVGTNGAFSSPLFVVHLQLPGARKDIYNHITCYFVRDIGKRESPHQIAVFDRMVDRFLDAPDHFRNTIFKVMSKGAREGCLPNVLLAYFFADCGRHAE